MSLTYNKIYWIEISGGGELPIEGSHYIHEDHLTTAASNQYGSEIYEINEDSWQYYTSSGGYGIVYKKDIWVSGNIVANGFMAQRLDSVAPSITGVDIEWITNSKTAAGSIV